VRAGKAKKERIASQQAALRAELDQQRQAVAAARAAEEADKLRFAEEQAEELRRWKIQEAERHQRKAAAIQRVKVLTRGGQHEK
jgi:hypothetical protein